MKNIILLVILSGSIAVANCANDDDISKLYGSGYKGKDQYYKDFWNNQGFSVDVDAFKKFVSKVKTLELGVDTPDDVIRKAGSPKSKLKTDAEEEWSYTQYVIEPYMIFSKITIGSDGKLKQIKITKVQNNNVQDVYNKSLSDVKRSDSISSASPPNKPDKLVATVFSDVPVSPVLGQIYINTTDSHFYGWNGKEWKQLDK